MIWFGQLAFHCLSLRVLARESRTVAREAATIRVTAQGPECCVCMADVI